MSSPWDKAVSAYKASDTASLPPPPLKARHNARRPLLVCASAAAVSVIAGTVAYVGWSSRDPGNGVLLVEPSSTPSATSTFPPDIYPSPATFPDWGSPGGCPSVAGLSLPDPAAASDGALAAINRRGSTLESNEAVADRALWPVIELMFDGQASIPAERPLQPGDVVGGPAANTINADLIRNRCGAAVLADSWAISDAPSTSPALATTFYVVVRKGTYLLWMTNP